MVKKRLTISLSKEAYEFVMNMWEKAQKENLKNRKRISVSEIVEKLLLKAREAIYVYN